MHADDAAPPAAPRPPPPRPPGGRGAAPPIPSDRLFAGATEVQIEHRGVLYRLRQTSLGKLILTK